MSYVEMVTYSLLINGDQISYIKPGRNLGKETLYLLIYSFCARRALLALIKDACIKGHIKAICFKDILAQYEEWSGQKVTVHKSSVVFSPNVQQNVRDNITNILGMPEVPISGKVSGSPDYH
ncbi:hypothetical protein LIER_40130 [Lithospermum erythrorhizon]|uniref:Uncharacterized protein n=1 Tax=Lithospermum erythrorhizon TaxID=34254 RepID=A0AAV3QQ05_LITER